MIINIIIDFILVNRNLLKFYLQNFFIEYINVKNFDSFEI